ncbi:MAG TPA: hypothetical protein VHE35_23975, partial [Kofleriaceae bacterium]|nr:hypothetical protein [Kofleriaceae bacterium]
MRWLVEEPAEVLDGLVGELEARGKASARGPLAVRVCERATATIDLSLSDLERGEPSALWLLAADWSTRKPRATSWSTSSQIAWVLPEPGGPSRNAKSGVASAFVTESRCSRVPSQRSSASTNHDLGGPGSIRGHCPLVGISQ